MWPQHILKPLFVSENYFRPLPLLSFVVEARLGGLDPLFFHLTNLLLHAINTTLVSLLAVRLVERGGDRTRATLAGVAAGLMYGWHPILVEAVCWVSDRFDLMMTAFLLLALLADLRMRNERLRAATVGLLFLLAALSKETTAVFAILLPVWHLAKTEGSGSSFKAARAAIMARAALMTYAAVIVAGLIYLSIRFAALGGLYRPDATMQAGSILQHALLVAKTLGWYATLLVWPFGRLSPVHPGVTPVPVEDLLAWAGLGALVLAAWVVWRLIRTLPASGFLALAGLASLLPVANILPLTIADNIVHDRYLAFPLTLFALAAATGLAALPGAARRVAVPAVFAWAAFAGTAVSAAIPQWESNLTLWKWAYDKAPESNIARSNYMLALVNAMRDAKALEIGKVILEDQPDNPEALHNMALALMHLGRDAEAVAYVREALQRLQPIDAKHRLDISESLNLLGYLHMRQGEWDEAESALNEAVRITPSLPRPHFNLAMLNLERGRESRATRELEVALQLDPPEMIAVHRRLFDEKRGDLSRARPPS